MAARRNKVETIVTYLEMTAPPTQPPPPPPAIKTAFLKVERPPVHYYRYLYETVGQPWGWWERRLMADADLAAVLADHDVQLYVLYVEGAPAGYGELDARARPDVEIAYFGMLPEFVGRGLGRFLMRQVVDAAWLAATARVWLHTCTLDHPGALAFYQRAGFRPYRRETKVIDDPKALAILAERPEL